MRSHILAIAACCVLPMAAAALDAPLDSSQPLPAEFQPAVNEVLDLIDSHLVPSNSGEEALKKCWLDTLRDVDGDDRVIRWSRICPHTGVGGLICRVTSDGEKKLGELIHSKEDVPAANQQVDEKFITHLKSDLLIKLTDQPAAKDPRGYQGIYVAHLAAMRQDVLLAVRKLPAQPGVAYGAIGSWIDDRKSEPKSFYRCIAMEE